MFIRRKSGKIHQLTPFDSKHEKMLILTGNMRNGDENMAFSPLDWQKNSLTSKHTPCPHFSVSHAPLSLSHPPDSLATLHHAGVMSVSLCYSAGAGRTGTFCALSTVLERVKAEGILDVFQTVKSLRLQRPHMVQTLVCCPAYLSMPPHTIHSSSLPEPAQRGAVLRGLSGRQKAV